MLGVERLGGAFVGGVGHQLMPPVVAAGLHVDGRAGALVDDHVLYRWAGLQRFFNRGKQFDLCAAAVGAVLRDDGDGL